MENRQDVQFALLCLEELDQPYTRALSPLDLSRRLGVHLAACESILGRLSRAGLIEHRPEGTVRLCRPVEEVTALEVLQAVWAPQEKQTTFRMLVGKDRGRAVRKTLEFVRSDQSLGRDAILNG